MTHSHKTWTKVAFRNLCVSIKNHHLVANSNLKQIVTKNHTIHHSNKRKTKPPNFLLYPHHISQTGVQAIVWKHSITFSFMILTIGVLSLSVFILVSPHGFGSGEASSAQRLEDYSSTHTRIFIFIIHCSLLVSFCTSITFIH